MAWPSMWRCCRQVRRGGVRAALMLVSLAALALPALSQSLPPGARIVTPAETVQLEHDDRKRRLIRLSQPGNRALVPRFHDYVVPKSALNLKSLPVDIPVLRVVFDTRVFFDFDRHELKPDATAIIDTVAASLRREPPDVSLFVAGHTDGVGADDYNYELGLRRARAVAEALAGRQIRQVNIYRVSFGKKVPVAGNETDQGRAQNRRVEFLFAAHSHAIAYWLSKQPGAVCDNDRTGCRFEVELVNPPSPVSLPSLKSGADLGEKKTEVDLAPKPSVKVELPTPRPIAEAATKRYVIDLTEQKFEIPRVER